MCVKVWKNFLESLYLMVMLKLWKPAFNMNQPKREKMRKLLEALHKIAIQFCELHGITWCNRRVVKHSHYQ